MTILMPIIPYKIAFDASPNFRVLLFVFALSTLTGVVFGLVPALRSVRSGLVTSLRAHAGGAPRVLLGRFLVMSQVAFAVVLLVITGLFVRSLNNITALDTGFDRERLAFLTVDLSLAGLDRDAGRLLYQDLEQRLSSLAGVTAVGFASNLPLDDEGNSSRVWGEIVSADDEHGLRAEYSSISPDHFVAMGIEQLAGRSFTRSDTPDAPASDRLVRRRRNSRVSVQTAVRSLHTARPFSVPRWPQPVA